MKAYVVLTVARQVDGDLVLVRVEKGYTERSRAEAEVSKSAQQTVRKIDTEIGSIDCMCVRSVYEVDIEKPSLNDIEDIARKL